MSRPEISFGPFRFSLAKGLLWYGDTPVPLGSRTAAILTALLETPGRLVSRTELLQRAWPGRTVNDANLKVQISGLRKALLGHGDLIRAEASLGYRFVGEVSTEDLPKAPQPKRRSTPRHCNQALNQRLKLR